MQQLLNISRAPIHKALQTIVGKHKDKRTGDILFLENDNVIEMEGEADYFRDYLLYHRVRHTILTRIQDLPIEWLKEAIIWHETIVFQTTGTFEIVRTLRDFIASYKDMHKTIIECYYGRHFLNYLPDGTIHTAYLLRCGDEDLNNWSINQVTTEGIID